MIHDLRGKTVAVVLGVCLFAGGGCASSRMARFYTLSPMSAPGEPSRTVPAEQGIAVAVGPVAIPDYLDRPQILTRSGPSEHKLAEFERWAGSLEADVSRVLVENLSTLLSPDNVTVLRWGGDAYPFPAEYRVGVDVTRFEGTIEESVTLAAQWYVSREGDKKILSARESIVKEPVEGQDYDALVGAMSRALAALSREIAGAIPAR
ncbi:MAG: PqiC family protein [Candidatus Deferrimicrobiaceae bacterium]